jgi:hypothetical protein
MLTKEENERITCVGTGTPTGDVFRRYWIERLRDRLFLSADQEPAFSK